MYPGQFRPGIDAHPGGPPIGAIAGQPGRTAYPPAYPSAYPSAYPPAYPPTKSADQLERERAHAETLAAVEAATCVWDRLVRAFSWDYQAVRRSGESWSALELHPVHPGRGVLQDAAAQGWATPPQLWGRMAKQYSSTPQLTYPESQEFASWFAAEAARRSVAPTSTLAWPEPRRTWRGQIQVVVGEPVYNRGPQTDVWEILWSQTGRRYESSYIATDGRLWVTQKRTSDRRGLETVRGLDAFSLVHAGQLLGFPHPPNVPDGVPRLVLEQPPKYAN